MGWFHCNSVCYVGLMHFCVSLIDFFEKINVSLLNTVLGQASVIAYYMLFLETSSNSLVKCFGSIAIQCFTLV